MSINIPGDIAVDIREPILGDSFSWAGLEPAAAKKVLVVHATAGQNPNEDGFTMAEQHVNGNGWGGIGVHFVITHDSYPGRPGLTPAGAHAQYVGDLLTWRAGVANNNPGRVHMEICGLFTPGNGVPTEAQLRAAKGVIDFLLAKNNLLPSFNFPSQIDYHNHQAIQPAGATACPGWQHPQFNEWFGYLQGGAEPSWFSRPNPQPAPAPVSVVVAPPQPVDNRPDYEKTWKAGLQQDGSPLTPKVVAVPEADITDVSTEKKVGGLAGGTPVNDLAGTFTHNSAEFVRTVYSATHTPPLWNAILLSELKDVPPPEPESLLDPAAVTVAPKPGLGAVDGISVPTTPVAEATPQPEPTAPTPAESDKALNNFLESLLGILLYPARLIGLINHFLKGGK